MIRTNNPSCLFYLSALEQERSTQCGVAMYHATAAKFPVPAAEIPLLSFSLDIPPEKVMNKRFQDFPELFDSNKKIRQVVVPQIKNFIGIKEIPGYLAVLSLRYNDEALHIMSPSTALIIGNLPSIMQRDM